MEQPISNQPINQKQTKWRQIMANLNGQFVMYRQIFNVNTGNGIKILMKVKVTRAVTENHIIFLAL